jgi:hypothetical protein
VADSVSRNGGTRWSNHKGSRRHKLVLSKWLLIQYSDVCMETRTVWYPFVSASFQLNGIYSTTVIRIRNVRFEVFTAVTMKNGVFWDVTPCCSSKNRRYGGT